IEPREIRGLQHPLEVRPSCVPEVAGTHELAFFHHGRVCGRELGARDLRVPRRAPGGQHEVEAGESAVKLVDDFGWSYHDWRGLRGTVRAASWLATDEPEEEAEPEATGPCLPAPSPHARHSARRRAPSRA